MGLEEIWFFWFFLVIYIGMFSYPWLKKRWKKYQFRMKWKLNQHLPVYQTLFSTLNGFELSKEARRIQGNALEYVYGEINFEAFVDVLVRVQPTTETVFYDLGSGTGTAVIACAMVFPVKKSCGIELFEQLYQAALRQKNALIKQAAYQDKVDVIQFKQGNFLTEDFSDATLIFINATSYFGESWMKLNQRLDTLVHCTHVITTSKPLKTEHFRVVHIQSVRMSWGRVNAYIHQRDKF